MGTFTSLTDGIDTSALDDPKDQAAIQIDLNEIAAENNWKVLVFR